MYYDIIGDVHGCSETLKALLHELDYRPFGGVYRHPDRQAIFLGDFIDRGPGQREVIDIVRPMIDEHAALAVMANHEFNAISFATCHGDGHLREHSEKNINQHRRFLEAYPPDSNEYCEIIGWFKALPLWIDLGAIRIVHACWDSSSISNLDRLLGDKPILSDQLLLEASMKGSPTYDAIETILKGKEIPLPEGVMFQDKDGHPRRHIRIKWWDETVITHREAFIGPPDVVPHIPEDPIDRDYLLSYGREEPPCFIGHYWLEGNPVPLARNIACLDYSVAKAGGKLVAYRWDGETTLAAEKFVAVESLDT